MIPALLPPALVVCFQPHPSVHSFALCPFDGRACFVNLQTSFCKSSSRALGSLKGTTLRKSTEDAGCRRKERTVKQHDRKSFSLRELRVKCTTARNPSVPIPHVTLYRLAVLFRVGRGPVAIRLYGEREFYNLAGAAFVSDPLPPPPPLGYVVSRNSARRCAVSVGFSRLTKWPAPGTRVHVACGVACSRRYEVASSGSMDRPVSAKM
jgi:hypothetical protein